MGDPQNHLFYGGYSDGHPWLGWSGVPPWLRKPSFGDMIINIWYIMIMVYYGDIYIEPKWYTISPNIWYIMVYLWCMYVYIYEWLYMIIYDYIWYMMIYVSSYPKWSSNHPKSPRHFPEFPAAPDTWDLRRDAAPAPHSSAP